MMADPGDIARRYQAGATIAEISAETGVAKSNVRKVLVRAGVELRRSGPRPGHHRRFPPEGGWKPDRFADEAWRMRRAGQSIRQIARQLNIAPGTVKMALLTATLRDIREKRPTPKGGRIDR